MKPDYVLRFRDNWKTALWGAENWLVSAYPAMPSVIANGPLAGRALPEVLPGFPLLVKLIDARIRLSVQVHPNERSAAVVGGDPKTEMWCMLADGEICAGFRAGTDESRVAAAAADGSIGGLLARHHAKKGDVFFIPGGMVHAIGDGTRLYEVQQSSDTTYRLYDWGRVGADGRPRELHVAKSLAAMDCALPAPAAQKGVSCPYFDFSQMTIAGERRFAPSDSYRILHLAEGDSAALDGEPLPAGACALVPPGVAFCLSARTAWVFVTRVPVGR